MRGIEGRKGPRRRNRRRRRREATRRNRRSRRRENDDRRTGAGEAADCIGGAGTSRAPRLCSQHERKSAVVLMVTLLAVVVQWRGQGERGGSCGNVRFSSTTASAWPATVGSKDNCLGAHRFMSSRIVVLSWSMVNGLGKKASAPSDLNWSTSSTEAFPEHMMMMPE